jgi:hypothetical protein
MFAIILLLPEKPSEAFAFIFGESPSLLHSMPRFYIVLKLYLLSTLQSLGSASLVCLQRCV